MPRKVTRVRSLNSKTNQIIDSTAQMLVKMRVAGIDESAHTRWPPGEVAPELPSATLPVRLRVALFGLWNRGKTTLADALLKTTMLPRWPIPTTLVATHVIPGEGATRIVAVDNEGIATEIEETMLADITLFADTRNNLRELWISYDCELLRHGIELIDLPGVDVARSEEVTAAIRSLPPLDLILFVLRSDEALVESEQSLLRALTATPCPPPIIVVVNDVDADFDERSRALIRQRVESFPPVKTAGAFWSRIDRESAHTVDSVHFTSAMSMLRAAVIDEHSGSSSDSGSLGAILERLADSAHDAISAQSMRWLASRVLESAVDGARTWTARVAEELAEADLRLQGALDAYYNEFTHFQAQALKAAEGLRKKTRNAFDEQFSSLTGWRLHHETPDALDVSYKDWYANYFAEAAGEADGEWDKFRHYARDHFPFPSCLAESEKSRLLRRKELRGGLGNHGAYLAANVSRPYRGFWASVFGDPWDEVYIDRVRSAYKREWPADREAFLGNLAGRVDSYMAALDELRGEVQSLIVAEADSRRDPLRARQKALADATNAANTLLRRLADEARG